MEKKKIIFLEKLFLFLLKTEMQRYRLIQDQKSAFDFINQQNWSSHYKSIARYRWKLRYTPDTIKHYRKECSICYERFYPKPPSITMPCCHYKLVCPTCFEKLDTCPFCRVIWKNKVVVRILWNDIIHREDILEVVMEILQQLYPEYYLQYPRPSLGT